MHMQRNWVSGVFFSLVFTALISACSSASGGDATSTPPPAATSAEGLWTGTSDDGRAIAGAVLDDGTYWFLYSMVGHSSIVAGAFQGNGSADHGIFTSSNGRNFNLERGRLLEATVTARYVTRQSLKGTLHYMLEGVPFYTSTFISTFAPESDDTLDLTHVAGTYTGSMAFSFIPDIDSYTVTVSPSGTFSMPEGDGLRANTAGIAIGCGYTGALSPRTQRNVYDISFTHTRRGCGTETFTGIAVLAAATKRLYILALDSDRSRVFPFMGTKQ